MADDFVLNVRQIYQYPRGIARLGDRLLFQQQSVGGPYRSVDPVDLVGRALELGGWLHLAPGSGIAWNGAALSFGADGFAGFDLSEQLTVPSVIAESVSVGGVGVATLNDIAGLTLGLEQLAATSVRSFNGRTGHIALGMDDIIAAHGAPVMSPRFFGVVRAPTIGNPRACSDEVATTAFVQKAITNFVACFHPFVFSFNGRTGFIELSVDDIVWAGGAPLNSPRFTGQPRAPTPWWGDNSTRIANTEWVRRAIANSEFTVSDAIKTYLTTYYAPLANPVLSGVPQGPTAAPGNSTSQLATTAFVMDAVQTSVSGVSSFNTRSGAITLTAQDIYDAGGAVTNSPTFTGTPSAPTPAAGNASTQLATTAFVQNAIQGATAGVETFNGRSGIVTLQLSDVTAVGGAPQADPSFSGVPTAPTAPVDTNTNQLATCAWVLNQVGAISSGVTTFNGRSGAITLNAVDISAAGGAPLANPQFTGIPTSTTAAPGTSTTQIATTAFVTAALGTLVGVASFNTRTGAVALQASDVTGVGGALLASPTFTGTPSGPTAAAGTSSSQLATTAFVAAALAAALNNTNLTGVPVAPTAVVGTNTTQIASTAFVQAAVTAGIAATVKVTTFNGRSGAVTLTAADLSGVGGALLAGPALTGVPTAPTAVPGTNTQQLATTAFVMAALSTASGGGAYSVTTIFTPGAAAFSTPPDSTTATVYRVRMVAAGGGGGGVGSSTGNWTGGNGGAGQYKEFVITGLVASTPWTINIGAAGAAGSGAGATGNNAGNGGATSVTIGGQAIVCNGGAGGQNGSLANGGAGGTGGATPAIAGLTMILDLPGQSGAAGNSAVPTPPAPGTPLGDGGTIVVAAGQSYPTPYKAPVGYGGGGAAGMALSTAGTVGGGGAVIIERIAG